MPESSPAIAAPATISRPDPDPTVLTTQALYREINQVKQLLDANVAGVKETLSARITAIDRDLAVPAGLFGSHVPLDELHLDTAELLVVQRLQRIHQHAGLRGFLFHCKL